MALSKEQKQAQVQDLTQKMSDASSVIFANYIGLSVSEISELRNKLREAGAEMKVAKKTLMTRAAQDAKLPEFNEDDLEGPVSLIFSYEDPLSGAQVAFKYSKEHDQVALIGGVFDGKLLTKAEALELAKMPSRDQLLATFASMIRSPLVSFAGMCNSPLTGFARALNEMADKGGFAESTAEEAPAAAETTEEQPAEEASPQEEDTKAEADTEEEKAAEPESES